MANVYYRHPQIKEIAPSELKWTVDLGQSYTLSNVRTFLSSNNYILSAMTDTTNPWNQTLQYTLPNGMQSINMSSDVMCYYIIFSSPIDMEQTNFSFQNIKLYKQSLRNDGYLDTAFFYSGLIKSMYFNHYIYDALGNYYFLDYITDLDKTQLVGLFLGIRKTGFSTIAGYEYINPVIEYEYPYTKFTAADINAAPTNHTHTWADLHGGPLSLAQGGTGRTDLVDNAVIYKSGSQFKGLTVTEGILTYQPSTDQISWQPYLAINAGGTGKTSRAACWEEVGSHKTPSLAPNFTIHLGEQSFIGRLYQSRQGFRVLVPLNFSWDENAYDITFSASVWIRQMNATWAGNSGTGYLFGSSASTAVPISNISGASNNFTTACSVNQFPGIGCIEIIGESGVTQSSAIGMGPISVVFNSSFSITFTAA